MKEIKPDSLAEKMLESELMYKGYLLEVRKDRVLLPNQQESSREYVKHQGAVLIIPVLDDGSLILERQFRYPLGEVVLEVPAGKIDPGEDTLETAKRELSEETGYSAAEWRHIGFLYPCVGYSDERIEIYLARGLTKARAQHLDQGEFVELFTLSLDEALDAIRTGQIVDAKTTTALFWAEKILRNGW